MEEDMSSGSDIRDRHASMDASLGELAKQLSNQTSRLIHQEIELAKAELTTQGKTKVQQATPPVPEQATGSVKEDV
jgi:hypothetical protein